MRLASFLLILLILSCSTDIHWSRFNPAPDGLGPSGEGSSGGTPGGTGPATALGRLDTSFNGTGWVATPVGSGGDSSAFAMAVDSVGRAVVVGSAVSSNMNVGVVRYTDTGELDSEFDGDGIAEIDIGPLFGSSSVDEQARAIAIDSEDRLLIAGYTNHGGGGMYSLVFVLRLKVDGSIDDSFASNGLLLFAWGGPGSSETATGIAIQSDGKIIVTGGVRSGLGNRVGVARLKRDGVLDSDFATNGLFSFLDSLLSQAMPMAVAIESNRAVVVGYAVPNYQATNDALMVLKCAQDGGVDSSFGTGATGVSLDFSAGMPARAHALVLHANGKKTLAGYTSNPGPDTNFNLVRFLSDGSALDTGFDDDGKVVTALSAQDDTINALGLHSGGEIFASGSAANRTLVATARYKSNGSPDTTYGDGGIRTFDIMPFGLEAIQSSHLLSSGKIYLAGFVESGSMYSFLLVRIE